MIAAVWLKNDNRLFWSIPKNSLQVYDDANFLFEHSDMCLSADPYTCRQDTRTGDGRFFVIENSPFEQPPPILWILCAIFYNV